MYITLKVVEKYTMISFQNVHTYVIVQKLEIKQIYKTILSPMVFSYRWFIPNSEETSMSFRLCSYCD